MDEQRIADEEVNQPLLITVTDTEDQVPELRWISADDQESDSANSSRWSSLFKLFLAITIIGVFVASLSLIIYITPNEPNVHVHSMQLSFTDHKLPIWSAMFSIKNSNEKLCVTYENPSVWVFYRRRPVWSVRVGSFGQKGGEENEVVVKGDETGVIDEAAAREMEEEVEETRSVVGLDMVFLGRVGFYPGASALWGQQNMTAVCENVRVRLMSIDNIFFGKNRSVLSFDIGRRDCRVCLPMFP